jgi:hypothetical protein
MPQPLTVTQKLVIFKAALVDIEDIINNTKLSFFQKEDKIRKIIDDELNFPSDSDKAEICRMRDRIMKHGR